MWSMAVGCALVSHCSGLPRTSLAILSPQGVLAWVTESLALAFSTKFCSLAKKGKWTWITKLFGVFRLDKTAHLNLSTHFLQSSPDEALCHNSVQWGFPDGITSAGRNKVTNSRKSPTFHTRWLSK